MKFHIINILLLCHIGFIPVAENTSVVFRFKTAELLRFSLHDCPASISAKSHVFPRGTVLSIQPNQNSTTKIYYQIDGSPEQPYVESIRLVAKGEHVITLWIHSGNDSILNSIKFKVVE